MNIRKVVEDSMIPFIQLNDISALDKLLAAPGPFLLFKHSAACPLSAYAYRQVAGYLENRIMPLLCGIVVVQHAREVSAEIARRLAITHESPQVILIDDGEVLWYDSHNGITKEKLIQVTELFLSRGTEE